MNKVNSLHAIKKNSPFRNNFIILSWLINNTISDQNILKIGAYSNSWRPDAFYWVKYAHKICSKTGKIYSFFIVFIPNKIKIINFKKQK